MNPRWVQSVCSYAIGKLSVCEDVAGSIDSAGLWFNQYGLFPSGLAWK